MDGATSSTLPVNAEQRSLVDLVMARLKRDGAPCARCREMEWLKLAVMASVIEAGRGV
jgi:hypothetical protein